MLLHIHIPLLGPKILVSGCLMATLIWSISVFPVWSATPTSLTPTPNLEALEVTINIRSREFRPDSLTVTAGQKTPVGLEKFGYRTARFCASGVISRFPCSCQREWGSAVCERGFCPCASSHPRTNRNRVYSGSPGHLSLFLRFTRPYHAGYHRGA